MLGPETPSESAGGREVCRFFQKAGWCKHGEALLSSWQSFAPIMPRDPVPSRKVIGDTMCIGTRRV